MSASAQEAKNLKIIRDAQHAESANRACADCSALSATGCAGIHREFNHRIKGISMSRFTTEEAQKLAANGNAVAKRKYLANWGRSNDPNEPEPGHTDALRRWIRAKYVEKRWMDESVSEAPAEPLTNVVKDLPPIRVEQNFSASTSPAVGFADFTAVWDTPPGAANISSVNAIDTVTQASEGFPDLFANQPPQQPPAPAQEPPRDKTADLKGQLGSLFQQQSQGSFQQNAFGQLAEFSQHEGSFAQQQGSFLQQGGYPQQHQGNVHQNGGFSQQQQGSFPPVGGLLQQQGGLTQQIPQQQGRFPHQQQDGFPQQQGGFPQQQGGFPQQQGGFPQQQGGFPQQQGGFSQQQGGFPQQQGAFPQQQQGGFSQQQQGFAQQQGAFPQQQGGFTHQQGGFSHQQGGFTQGSFAQTQGAVMQQNQHGGAFSASSTSSEYPQQQSSLLQDKPDPFSSLDFLKNPSALPRTASVPKDTGASSSAPTGNLLDF